MVTKPTSRIAAAHARPTNAASRAVTAMSGPSGTGAAAPDSASARRNSYSLIPRVMRTS
jgi:hypothetical protein